jgi:hypothetical protein
MSANGQTRTWLVALQRPSSPHAVMSLAHECAVFQMIGNRHEVIVSCVAKSFAISLLTKFLPFI